MNEEIYSDLYARRVRSGLYQSLEKNISDTFHANHPKADVLIKLHEERMELRSEINQMNWGGVIPFHRKYVLVINKGG